MNPSTPEDLISNPPYCLLYKSSNEDLDIWKFTYLHCGAGGAFRTGLKFFSGPTYNY